MKQTLVTGTLAKRTLPALLVAVLVPAALLPLAGMVASADPAGASGTAGAPGVFPYPYQRVALANGFTAYLIPADTPGQIGYITVVRAGSREEIEPGKTGFAHFFEHMMFRGTKAHPNYGEELSRLGARNNAFTDADMTVFFVGASREYLERVMEIESDRFRNLDYSESDFRTEAGAVLGEYMQDRASPYQLLEEKTRETAFDAHTYRHTTLGYEADVRAMPEGFAYSRQFFRKYYRPENCVLVLSGDFDVAAAKAMIGKYYQGWERGYVAPPIPVEPEQTAPRRAEVAFPGQTLPIVSVGWKSPAWSANDREVAALGVLGQAGFGSNSALYKKLVIQEQKAQSLSPEFRLGRDPGLVVITAMVQDSAGVQAVESEIEATAGRFQNELMDERALADTKSNMKYGFLMRMEGALGIAFSPLPFVVNTGGLEAIEDAFRTLDTVTAEDVRAAARRWLVDRARTVVVLTGSEGKS